MPSQSRWPLITGTPEQIPSNNTLEKPHILVWPSLVALVYYIALHCAAMLQCVPCVWAVVKHTIRSGVLSPPGLITSEDGSSHLDLQLCRFVKEAKFLLVLWRNIFLLSCRHDEIFLLLSSCSCRGNIWRCSWTGQMRKWSAVRSPCHVLYHSFFKTVFSLMFSPYLCTEESTHVSRAARCSLPLYLSF